jgi:hypothetical protein
VVASIWLTLLPVWILAGLVVLFGILALLSRVQGGKYVRPIAQGMLKVPLLGRGMRKASQAALERQNPELASALEKLQRSGAISDPMKAQQAMSRLSAAERRAYMDAVGEQTEVPAEMNRQMRRQLERARKRGRR